MQLPPLFDNFLTRFEVTQHGVVYSKWLRIPELLVFALLFSSTMCYHLVYHLAILKQEHLKTSVLVDITSPGDNMFQAYANPMVNLLDFEVSATDVPFCKQSGSPLAKRDCKRFPRAVLVPSHIIGESIFVASTVATFKSVEGGPNKYTSLHNVQRFDQTIIHLKLNTVAPAGFDFRTAQGFMKFQGEDNLRLIRSVDASLNLLPTARADKACGDVLPKQYHGHEFMDSGMCVSTDWGEFYSVATLLRAVNVSLDGEDDLRSRGLYMDLHITFTNIDLVNFWSWPFGYYPKYVVEPVVTVRGTEQEVQFATCADVEGVDCIMRRGLAARFTVKGHFGSFSLFHAITKLSIAFLCLGACKIIISKGLVNVYGLFQSYRHIPVLHSHAEFEDHDFQEIAKKLLEEGHSMELTRKILSLKRTGQHEHDLIEDDATNESDTSNDNWRSWTPGKGYKVQQLLGQAGASMPLEP